MGKNNNKIIYPFSFVCRGVREIWVGFYIWNRMRWVENVFIFLQQPNSRLPEVRANLDVYTSRLCIKCLPYIHCIFVKAEVSWNNESLNFSDIPMNYPLSLS